MIPKIKLDKDSTVQDFVKNNHYDFWKYTISAIRDLVNYPDKDSTIAFILYGGKINGELPTKVTRDRAIETIEKAIENMIEYEEYEICQELENYKKEFK
jgi:hypothetical protein